MDGTAFIDVEILGVTEKNVTRKADGHQIKMYDVQVTDGTQAGTVIYSTTFVEEANKAFEMLNKHVQLSVKVEQNGKWINRYLQRVIGEIDPPQAQPVANGGGFAGAQQQVQPDKNDFFGNQIQTSFGINGGNGVTSHTEAPETKSEIPQSASYENEREKSIHRQCASKVAAMLFVAGDSQVDFFDNVDALVRFYESGVKPLSVEIAQESR